MSEPILSIQGLKVNYGGIEAVKEISFDVPQGEIVTLIGANGAGKSSTLRAISGLVKPTSGKIFVDGAVLLGKIIIVLWIVKEKSQLLVKQGYEKRRFLLKKVQCKTVKAVGDRLWERIFRRQCKEQLFFHAAVGLRRLARL